MTKDEALDLALEALEAGEYYINDLEAIVYAADDLGTDEDRAKMQEAITAIKQARAAPVQEPSFKVGNLVTLTGGDYPGLGQWFVQLWDGDEVAARVYGDDREAINRRIAALNTPPAAQPAPVQEPVVHDYRTKYDRGCYKCLSQFCPGNCIDTTPPAAQRQWVGLTDEQISAIGSKIFPSTWNTRHVEFARAIETKLKELNT